MQQTATATPPPGFWDVLRLRPFLPLAFAAGLGAAWGAASGAEAAHWTGHLAGFCALPVLLLLGCLGAACLLRATQAGTAAVIVAATAVYAVFFGVSFDRQQPPRGDISAWVRGAVPDGPQEPVDCEVRGTVTGAPRLNDFGQEFQLTVTRIARYAGAARTRGKKGGARKLATENAMGTVWVRAPRDADIRAGDTLRLRGELTDLPRAGNVGERQIRARYVEEGCWCLLRVKETRAMEVLGRNTNGLNARLADWREALQNRYENAFRAGGRAYPATTARLLSAMILGDRAGEPLPPATRDAFRAAGLTHLLVASGSQVALLCALVLGLGRALTLRGPALFGCTLTVLVLYALLTGGAGSIWRAAVAGGCLAFAVSVGRPVDRLSLLALAFLALLCVDTAQIQDIGFQLTFAATWGLAVLAPALARRFGGTRQDAPAVQFIAAIGAAQLATLPFLLYHFGRAGAQGLAANAVALPLAALLVGCGLLGLVFPPANAVNYLLVSDIRMIAETVAGWPGARAVAVPLPLMPAVLFFLLLVLMALDFSTVRAIAHDELARLGWQRRAPWVLGLALLLGLPFLWRRIARDNQVRVTLLDVGQGESIVISRPGYAVLVDGGSSADEGRGDVGMSVIVPFLQSQGVTHLNAMVLTHADADHCNALKTVLREVPVDQFIDGAGSRPEATLTGEADYLELRDEVRRRQIPVVAAKVGQRLNLGDAHLNFLAPMLPSLPGDNDDGTVMMLEHGAFRMLLTADIERAGEERLARSADIHCNVLKVAHHGSATSTGALFLNAAHPQYAVLSCGRYNSFGHPALATLSRLAKAGVPVYRTDRDGAISIFSDGHAGRIETFR